MKRNRLSGDWKKNIMQPTAKNFVSVSRALLQKPCGDMASICPGVSGADDAYTRVSWRIILHDIIRNFSGYGLSGLRRAA